jgi:Zn-dependent oligopeptidase
MAYQKRGRGATMSAIGAVEDAYGAARDALDELDNAVDCAEGEGWSNTVWALRQLRDQLDDVANQLSHLSSPGDSRMSTAQLIREVFIVSGGRVVS